MARIAKAKGPSRLSALDQRIEIVGYEKKQPGEMIDINKLGRSQGVGHRITGDRTGQSAAASKAGWEYLHLAVHSRPACSEILPDEPPACCSMPCASLAITASSRQDRPSFRSPSSRTRCEC